MRNGRAREIPHMYGGAGSGGQGLIDAVGQTCRKQAGRVLSSILYILFYPKLAGFDL